MSPRLVYDVARSGFGATGLPDGMWVLPAIAIISLFVLCTGWPKPIGRYYRDRPFSMAFGILWSVAILGFSLIAIIGMASQSSELEHSYKTVGTKMVSGCVDRFHAGQEGRGNTFDMIDVGGHEFTYSDADVEPGFHHIETLGGPIHADSWVKLNYIGDHIVRVEVADHACPMAKIDADWRP